MACFSWRRAEVIAGSVDGSVRRFDVRMGRTFVDELHAPVTCVAVSHDGNCLLAACTDSCVRLLDRADGMLLQEYTGGCGGGTGTACCLRD